MVLILEHAGRPIGNVFSAGDILPFVLETLKSRIKIVDYAQWLRCDLVLNAHVLAAAFSVISANNRSFNSVQGLIKIQSDRT
jgi:hypothetical protein